MLVSKRINGVPYLTEIEKMKKEKQELHKVRSPACMYILFGSTPPHLAPNM
jgi:hypothetical protein